LAAGRYRLAALPQGSLEGILRFSKTGLRLPGRLIQPSLRGWGLFACRVRSLREQIRLKIFYQGRSCSEDERRSLSSAGMPNFP
jgi:hypothetical protein